MSESYLMMLDGERSGDGTDRTRQTCSQQSRRAVRGDTRRRGRQR